MENGGTIVTPHVGLDIQSGDGTVRQRIDPPPRRHLQINPAFLRTILEGLRAASAQLRALGGTWQRWGQFRALALDVLVNALA